MALQETHLRITARGWFVIFISIIIVTIGINLLARDACWDNNGIGSCTDMIQRNEQIMLKEGTTCQEETLTTT